MGARSSQKRLHQPSARQPTLTATAARLRHVRALPERVISTGPAERWVLTGTRQVRARTELAFSFLRGSCLRWLSGGAAPAASEASLPLG